MKNITEVQRLLNEKAYLQAQINVSAFDGSVEIKTISGQSEVKRRLRRA